MLYNGAFLKFFFLLVNILYYFIVDIFNIRMILQIILNWLGA